jgi:MtfA peptidase
MLKAWRRRRARRRAFPDHWSALLETSLPYIACLTGTDRRQLHELALIFMAEKWFEAAEGLELTEEMKALIAGCACLLELGRGENLFPNLRSVVVYPAAYLARETRRQPEGTEIDVREARSGEAWSHGTLLLAWDEVEESLNGKLFGRHIILHEFAHLLDLETGEADGLPWLDDGLTRLEWQETMRQAFGRLRSDLQIGRTPLIADYAATSPAEFFAVVSEMFFAAPLELLEAQPQVYQQLQRYYRQDPAAAFRERHRRGRPSSAS